MSFLFLKPAIRCRPYFPAELMEEFILDHAAAVRKLEFDSTCFQHIEADVESKRAFCWRCWHNPGKAMERLVNACSVKVPVLVAIMHIVGKVRGKPHLYSFNHFAMDRPGEKIMSRQ